MDRSESFLTSRKNSSGKPVVRPDTQLLARLMIDVADVDVVEDFAVHVPMTNVSLIFIALTIVSSDLFQQLP